MKKLVVLRHGESTWNKENRFTGWEDVDLSDNGLKEASQAGKLLIEEKYTFDVVYTSLLKRAIKTLWIVLEKMDLMWIPVNRDWRLNERHYGSLQGLNKAETTQKYGAKQVKIWRRSYDIPPPALSPDDDRFPGKDPRYASLSDAEVPLTECLKNTVNRFLPYWHETIAPAVKEGKNVFIVAHGNTLRALAKYLGKISDDDIVNLNIPTGIPLVFELEDDLSLIRQYYLGNPELAKKAAQKVAEQSKSG